MRCLGLRLDWHQSLFFLDRSLVLLHLRQSNCHGSLSDLSGLLLLKEGTDVIEKHRVSVLIILLSRECDLEQRGLGSDELMRENLADRRPLFWILAQEFLDQT